MKLMIILTSLVILFACTSKQKIRSTQNAEDRKYFKKVLDSLFFTGSTGIGESFTDQQLASLTNKVDIPFPIGLPEDSLTMQRCLDSSGFQIALFMYGNLLRQFPQFNCLTLTAHSKEHKELKMTYSFLGGKSLAYFNKTQNHIVKVHFQLPEE